MSENTSTGSFKVSRNGAHAGNTLRHSGNSNTAVNGKAAAITGVFKAASASGRHEAFQHHKPERPKMDPLKKRKIYIISVALVALIVIASAIGFKLSVARTKYMNYFENAQKCYSNGEYDNALTNIRRAETIKETDECRLLMADCYREQGNFDKALEVLRTMNLSDIAIKSKIAEIVNIKEEQLNSTNIVIGISQYDIRSSSLDLSAQNLDNNIFEKLNQMYSVTNLNISSNNIDSLEGIENLGGLITLDVSMNKIEDISILTKLENLRVLSLDGNPVKDLSPLYSMNKLTSLSIRGVSISEEQLVKISEALPGCAIHTVGEDTSAQDITIGGKTFKSDVTELDLSNLSLTDISAISQCKQLTKLTISENNITDISPVMDLPELAWLDISNNSVSDLRSLIALSNLRYLNASDNQIYTTNALGALNALEELNLDSNNIEDFSGLKKMYSLKMLSLKNTNLKPESLDNIKPLLNLKNLFIEDNPDITGEVFDAFTVLMQNCRISHSPLVYSQMFNGESYKENITELTVSGRELKSIDELNRFKSLQSIDFSDNLISNIYPFQYCCQDVISLNLSQNDITDISPVGMLKNLKYLDISYNNVTYISSLYNMSQLEYINLTGNDIPEDQMSKLRSALPLCEIIY